NRNRKHWSYAACLNLPVLSAMSHLSMHSRIFCRGSAELSFSCAKTMRKKLAVLSRNTAARLRQWKTMRPPNSTSTKTRHTRADDFPVQIKANGTIQVRTISLNVRFLQSAQDLVPRMPVHVPCSDGDDGKLRMYGSKQISSRCSRDAVVCHLKQLRLRMFFNPAL